MDQISGLPNRHSFERTLEEEIAKCHDYPDPFVVGLVDIDGLKSVNDRFGHSIGDNLVRRVGQVLQRSIGVHIPGEMAT